MFVAFFKQIVVRWSFGIKKEYKYEYLKGAQLRQIGPSLVA